MYVGKVELMSCDVCGVWSPEDRVQTWRIGTSGTRYNIDLCQKCSAPVQQWSALAKEKTRTRPPRAVSIENIPVN